MKPYRTAIIFFLLVQLASMSNLAAQSNQAALPASLRMVPQETAYFGSVMRLGEQVRLVLNSQAIQQARELKLVRYFEKQLKDAWKEQADENDLVRLMQSPEWQELQPLLIDLVDEEVFVSLDAEIVELTRGFHEFFQEAMRAVQQNTPLDGETPDFEDLDPETQAKITSAFIKSLPETLPSFMMGFKISHPDKLQTYVQQFEQQLTTQLSPDAEGAFSVLDDGFELQGTYRDVVIQGHQLKELVLPGENLIPAIEKDAEADLPADVAEAVKQYLAEVKLVLHWGMWDDYFLVRVSGSEDGLKKFGQSASLADHPDLKPLVAHAGKRFTSISYQTAGLQVTLINPWEAYWDTVQEGVLQAAGAEVDLTEKQKEEIRQEISDLMELFPEEAMQPGSVLSFEFLTAEGYEGFSYDHGSSVLDATKPLVLTKHLSPSPYIASVLRLAETGFYDRASKLFVKSIDLVEKYGLPNAPEEARRQYLELKQAFTFHLTEFDKITRNQFVPALKQAEFGFVLAPATKLDNLLPGLNNFKVPEPAFVVKLHSGEQFVEAMRGYYDLIPAMLETLNQVAPESSEDFPTELPVPEIVYEDDGEIYSFNLPPEADVWVGKDVGLYMGVRSDIAVFCFTSVQLKQLWKESAFPTVGLIDSNPQPAGMIYLSDNARLMNDLAPLAVQAAQLGLMLGGGGEVQLDDEFTITRKDWLEHLRFGFKLFATQQSYTSRVYKENKTTVTHSLNLWQDIASE